MEINLLDQGWFERHGARDSAENARTWREWNAARPRKHSSQVAEALRMTTRLSRSAVSHYLKGRHDQLSEATRNRLDALMIELGASEGPAPKPSETALQGVPRIALLAQVRGAPSPRFHMEVLGSILDALNQAEYMVTLHEVGLSPTKTVCQILRSQRPHGFVWVRLTPDAESLAATVDAGLLPSVVVHGRLSRDHYRVPPVIGHVFPDQSPLTDIVAFWCRGLPTDRCAEVGLAAMPADDTQDLRRQRIGLIEEGVQRAHRVDSVELRVRKVEVSDYSAGHAEKFVNETRDCAGWVCLSDEIAVSTTQILRALGEPVEGRVLGYDDSALAEHHHITSIGQHLDAIGTDVYRLFSRHFAHRGRDERRDEAWRFEEARTRVSLAVRR